MNRAITIFAITLAVSISTIGQQSSASSPLPYIDRGACPFECCTYRRWTVDKPTAIRARMSDKAKVLYRLRVGEKVLGMTGVVVTTRPGILEVQKDATLEGQRLVRGDRLYLLTYLGEGFYKVWLKGRIFEADPYDEAAYKLIQPPESVWWVKVRNSRGRIGWSRQPENFGNVDQCG